jgi:ABC-type thiamine transport system substrate-binding protein
MNSLGPVMGFSNKGHIMNITFPALITANDYHEFDCIANALKQFKVKCRFKEVGFADKGYMAVFYDTNLSNPKVAKLISLAKKKVKEFDNFFYV